MNTYVNAQVQNTIARMINGAKPTMYIHESQMNTDDSAPVQKHDCKNDYRCKTNNVHTRVPNKHR
jgi:hypothetical protein